MPETAVSDTGPILHLNEIGEVRQLRIFEAVTISEQVAAELSRHGTWETASSALLDCLRVEKVSAMEINEQAKAVAPFTVHRADLSVAVLSARVRPDVVITDDLQLRKGLESQGNRVVGSVGILVRAFRAGRLTRPELLACLDQLLDGSSLYTSRAFRSAVRTSLESLRD